MLTGSVFEMPSPVNKLVLEAMRISTVQTVLSAIYQNTQEQICKFSFSVAEHSLGTESGNAQGPARLNLTDAYPVAWEAYKESIGAVPSD